MLFSVLPEQAVNPWLVLLAAASCLIAVLALIGLFVAYLLQKRKQPVVFQADKPNNVASSSIHIDIPAQTQHPSDHAPGSRWLVVARGASRPVMLKLNPDGTLIGRSAENHMVLLDPQVSRYHARIAKQGEAWLIADLHSGNGTYVNEKSVTIQTLTPGDRIRLGDQTELVFQA